MLKLLLNLSNDENFIYVVDIIVSFWWNIKIKSVDLEVLNREYMNITFWNLSNKNIIAWLKKVFNFELESLLPLLVLSLHHLHILSLVLYIFTLNVHIFLSYYTFNFGSCAFKSDHFSFFIFIFTDQNDYFFKVKKPKWFIVKSITTKMNYSWIYKNY